VNPHPSHKIVRFKVLYDEIQYCDYCRLFIDAPEIEKPCRNRTSLLEKLTQQESFDTVGMADHQQIMRRKVFLI